jgi:hypothetical protein
MNATKIVSVVSLLVPAVAYAQPEEALEAQTSVDHAVGPVRNAFELGVTAGYSQGGGKLGNEMPDLDDVAGAGAAVELDAAYRIIPHLSVGAYGSFATYASGDAINDDTNVLAATAGVQAALHLRPDRSIDPWVSVGTGWKGLWLDPQSGKGTSLQGLELARLQLGVDYRVSEDVAIAPVIGGSISMFVSEDSPMTADYTEIASKEVNFTGFAGLAGRFDFGGSR